MITLDMYLTKDGKMVGSSHDLDPLYVKAVGIETIAARAADALWIKLQENA